MMDKSYILNCISKYAASMERYSPRRKNFWKYFDLKAYNRATVKLIMHEIQKSDAPPSIVVESMIRKFDEFACMAKVPETKQMFSTAYDMAVCIGDYILSLNERR